MRTGSANENHERSWTDRPEDPRNRLGAMVFLGLSALSLFSLFVWIYFYRPAPARSFVATLSIKDYQVDVPKIRLGEWLGEMSTVNGLFPWEQLPSIINSQNENDVKQFFSELYSSKKLDKQKDTALIQLRCHAAVTKQDTDNWSCGLYIDDDPTSNRPFPFSDFLNLAARVPAKNIVVFAEVADLQFEPHLGWVINPIEHYIRKACRDVDWKNQEPGKKVWIVCSNADYQSPLFSVKRAKTLFQEACEETLKEEALRSDRGNSLTLARYFELIYRHCHTASEGRQTPQLILANNSDEELPAADKVFISGYKPVKSPRKSGDDKSEKNKKGTKDENEPPTKVARNKRSNLLVPVSFRQTDAKPSQDPKSAKAVETDPGLRFWQLRDEIEARGADRNLWSPRDFSPFAWRKLQADVAIASIWNATDGESKTLIEDQAKAVAILRDSLATGSIANLDKDKKGAHWDIVHAWNDFRDSKSNFRSQWQNDTSGLVDPSTGLFDSEIETWQIQRQEYRSYVDCVAELGLWIEFTAEFATTKFAAAQLAKLKTDCEELISALVGQKQWIPLQSTQSAAELSKSLRLEKAMKIKGSLHGHIEDAISKLVDTKKDLTWLEERKYQGLLSSPLLKYEQRKQLVEALKLREPEKVVSKTDADFKSIQPPKPVVQVAEIRFHCDLLQRAWPLLSNLQLQPVPNNLDGLLVWGKVYGASQLQVATNDTQKSVDLWHSLSLIDPRFASKLSQDKLPSSKSWPGIVVAPIHPKTIRLSLNTPFLDFPDGKSEVLLRIKVVHFDGTDVPACDAQWTSKPDLKSLTIKHETKVIGSGQDIRLVPKGKEIVLNCSLPSGVSPESGTQILVSATSPTSKKESNQLTIPVFRNSDRIDLIARRVGDPVQLKEKKEAFIELGSPAIAGATSQFNFSLSNKQLVARRVGLKVYVVPSLQMPSKIDANLIAIAELAELAVLPAMQETPVKLKLIDPKRLLTQLENEDALNSMLVFEIIEYEMVDPKKGEAAKKPKGVSWRYSARFKPIHPLNEKFVKVSPSEVRPQMKCSIEFKTDLRLWEQYELKSLPITIRSQAIVNDKLTQKVSSATLMLKPDNTNEQFIGSVVDQNTQRFEADIGGFPRAVVFDAIPSLPDMKRWDDDQVRIVEFRLVLKEPIQGAVETKVEKVAVKKVKDQIVFPTLIDGEKVAYRAIEIDTVVDKGANSKITFEILKLEGKEEKVSGPQELSSDRSFTTKLKIQEDGTLAVEYVPSELKIRYSEGIENLDGTYVFRIHVGEQLAEQRFVFDKVPPTQAFVDAQGAKKIPGAPRDGDPKMEVTLFKGDEIEVWIEAEDSTGLGIETAKFAISKGRNPSSFDDDGTLGKALVTLSETGRVSMKLDSAQLEGRTKGEFWIVAKTVDWAGNIQLDNQPLKVNWKDTARPPLPK